MIAVIRAYWRQILAVIVLLYFGVVAIGKINAYGQRQYQSGRNAVIAENAIAASQARLDTDTRAAWAAQAGAALHDQLAIALPKIEVTTHDAIEKVQTIYLAAPAVAGAVCQRPASVQIELDAARSRANAAARGDL